MKKHNIAIIGCGNIAQKHIKAIIENNDTITLKALCDIDGQKINQLQELYKKETQKNESIKTYRNYEELLQDEEIDIITIATSSGIRPEIAKKAIKKRKHLILEKPLALSIKDCDEIINLTKEYQVKTAVCHQLRFMPHIQNLKNIMEQNKLGKIYYITAQMRWNRNDDYYKTSPWRGTWQYDGGALMNQAIHVIDIMLWLAKKPKKIFGKINTFSKPIEAEDTAMAIIEFEDNTLGQIEATVSVYKENLEEKLTVIAEKGTVVIGGKALEKIEKWHIEGEETIKDETIKPQNYHTFLYKDLIESINENKEPLINPEEAKKAVELILGIYKSSKEQKEIELPFKEFSTIEMKR
ncbi:Gfo/Idh/MocA family protein [Thermovenabulum sp.]|uniref:Gfo/Idh/MocA family protein n=1 Tax=Thermovenabulum sp. TaxID=3100335 RepID=UPI003C7A5301